jgi:glucose-6-phosphate 1-dehydrogenase
MAKSQSDALVIFGVTGDLAHKMIFPSLLAPRSWPSMRESLKRSLIWILRSRVKIN